MDDMTNWEKTIESAARLQPLGWFLLLIVAAAGTIWGFRKLIYSQIIPPDVFYLVVVLVGSLVVIIFLIISILLLPLLPGAIMFIVNKIRRKDD